MAINFDPNIYRANNQDLDCLDLSNVELEDHFNTKGYREPRIFAQTDNLRDRFSMQYIRGHGLEIGPGNISFPLYGGSTIDYADVVQSSHYKSDREIRFDNFCVDDKRLIKRNPLVNRAYDFVIASHVLEHANSLIQSLKNLSQIIRDDGVVYLILPTKDSDWDQYWMKDYGFIHHLLEYFYPKIFSELHRRSFTAALPLIRDQLDRSDSLYTQFSMNEEEVIRSEYIYHKHSYTLQGWVILLLKIINSLNLDLRLVDVARCSVRNDAHFIFYNASN